MDNCKDSIIEANDVKSVNNTVQAAIDIDSIPTTDSIYVDPIIRKKALRKFDKYVLPQLYVFALLCYLDRSNIGNARVFGFDTDLGLKGLEFNNLNTFFAVTYIVFETPWSMALKRFGPNKILAIALVSWSIITISHGFIHNYGEATALRLLLGAAEAGLTPCFAFIFTTIYDREDTSKRVGLLYLANVTSGAFGGLIAYGIQSMGEQRGLAAWRWLFIIEGVVSIVICGCCWFTFPATPETAWFLTKDEKAVMLASKQRNATYNGDDKFDWKWVKMAVTDPFVYLASWTFFCSSIAIFGFGTFLPTIIRGLGFNAFQANYLTIPVYAFGAMTLIAATALSDHFKNRTIFLLICPIPVIIGYLICVATPSPGAGYFAMFLCCSGIYSFNALLLTWATTNLAPDHKRSVGLPVFASFAGTSGLIAPQLYPSKDGPRYQLGNGLSLGFEAIACLSVIAVYLLLRSRNAKKQKLIGEGATNNGKEGDEALDFVYFL
ncbi:high-affinity nicotinic acid transporter [Cadophora sp. DSE1049]|nr:high-affinity nicotinic acid transporter [Cadophora sp. DSE1049]